MKNGRYETVLVSPENWEVGDWDLYRYLSMDSEYLLRDFGTVEKLSETNEQDILTRPLEYSHISDLERPSISVRFLDEEESFRGKFARGGQLLIGSMRAYLGNVALLPMPEQIGLPSEYRYPVKSEFLTFNPEDGLSWYWLWYLRSEAFLRGLPVGSGDTRARLDPKRCESVPVFPANVDERREIDGRLKAIAEKEWSLLGEIQDISSRFRAI